VTVPAAVKAGDLFEVKFTAAGAAGAQVYHLVLRDPAGKEDALNTKNYHAAGTGKALLQIPFNAAKGNWSVEITHVNTGLKALKKITVK
jgi:uncharacterized protein YfaS (alpha-2-macroglobulin family)